MFWSHSLSPVAIENTKRAVKHLGFSERVASAEQAPPFRSSLLAQRRAWLQPVLLELNRRFLVTLAAHGLVRDPAGGM